LFAKINQKTVSNEESMENQQPVILSKILKLINIIGIMASLFGFNYSYGFLRFVFGDKYSSEVFYNFHHQS